jgi:uncharacterized protein YwlG (UPF0340 family)
MVPPAFTAVVPVRKASMNFSSSAFTGMKAPVLRKPQALHWGGQIAEVGVGMFMEGLS